MLTAILIIPASMAWGAGMLAFLGINSGPIISLVWGLGVCGTTSITLGLLGLAFPVTAWIILAAGLALFYARMEWRGLVGRVKGLSGLSRPQIVVSVLLLISAVYSLLLSLVPPVRYDTIAAHLLLPQQFIFSHKVFHMEYFYPSVFPLTVQGEYLWSMLLGGGWRGPSLLNWLHAPMCAWAVGRMVSGLGGGKTAGIAAALAVFWIPLVLIEGSAPLVDLQVSLYWLLGWIFILEWLKEKTTRKLIFAGLLVGMSGSCKYNGLVLAIPMAAILLFQRKSIGKRICWMAILALSIALPMIPALTRNVLSAGAPLFPYLTDTEQALKINMWVTGLYPMGRSVGEWLALPFRIAWDWARISGHDLGQAGASLTAFYLIPLAYAGYLVSRKRNLNSAIESGISWTAMAFFISYTVMFFAGWSFRYMLPVMMMGTAMLVLFSGFRTWGLSAVLLLMFAGLIPQHTLSYDLRAYTRSGFDDEKYLRSNTEITTYHDLEYIRENTRPDARILCIFTPQVYYANRKAYPSLMQDRSVIERVLEESSSVNDVRNRLVSRRITDIIMLWPPKKDIGDQYLMFVTRRERELLMDFIQTGTTLAFSHPFYPVAVLTIN